MDSVVESAGFLAAHLEEVPVLMIPCLEGRPEDFGDMSSSFWASLFPAVWSFCLALRSRGLGSCWTTLHLLNEGERRAAEILDIPFDKYTQGGLFPIAYTKGADFRPAKRLPIEQIVHWDSW
jgi:nitroreductase